MRNCPTQETKRYAHLVWGDAVEKVRRSADQPYDHSVIFIIHLGRGRTELVRACRLSNGAYKAKGWPSYTLATNVDWQD